MRGEKRFTNNSTGQPVFVDTLGPRAEQYPDTVLRFTEMAGMAEEGLEATQTLVFWSTEPEGLPGGPDSAQILFRLQARGVKMIFISPDFSPLAGLFADKWFSPRPGTDAALADGLGYVWITEGLRQEPPADGRAGDRTDWRAHILGELDGIPRTPEWAANETRIPAREIRALAREWGSTRTTLARHGRWGAETAGAPGRPGPAWPLGSQAIHGEPRVQIGEREGAGA
nr:molybdopterin-dependent oxidoreductase [uncultured Holophaga sp.]